LTVTNTSVLDPFVSCEVNQVLNVYARLSTPNIAKLSSPYFSK